MSPPNHEIRNSHTSVPQPPNKHPTLPDLFLTVLSICFLISSSTKPLLSKTLFFYFPLYPRRSPKISSMSQLTFATPQSLSEWLKSRLPSDSFTSWGVKSGTKNIHNLWLELSEGETSLADSTPPIRTVNVVTVRIIDKYNRVLVESHQELSDGTVRNRGRPLSEKMKPFEELESAVTRAVREELGSLIYGSHTDLDSSGVVRVVPNSYRKKVEERNSESYPGLPACYVLHSVDALVDGLPEGEFCTVEDDEYRNCEC